MLMPAPKRDDKGVTFLPAEGLSIDYRSTASAKGVIDARARVPMALRALARPEHLHPARERGESRAAGQGVDVFQSYPFKEMSFALRELLERRIGIVPAIMKRRRKGFPGRGDRPRHSIAGSGIRHML